LQSCLSGSADTMEILINTTHERILQSWLTAAVHFQLILAETPTAQVWLFLLHRLCDLDFTACLRLLLRNRRSSSASFSKSIASLTKLQSWELQNPVVRTAKCSSHAAFTNCKLTTHCSPLRLQKAGHVLLALLRSYR
jgi:hypothetical protein